MLVGWLLLLELNQLLLRLAAMLPDETLRHETAFFAAFNRTILGLIPALLTAWFVLSHMKSLPQRVLEVLRVADETGLWFMLFLLLIPVATLMALLWKIKEAVFASVFAMDR